VTQLAFVAAPPLFMTLMLTSWPRQGIALRLPPWWAWPLAVLAGLALAPPMALLTAWILDQFPTLQAVLEEHRPLTARLLGLAPGEAAPLGTRLWYFLVLAVLPAGCEEVAFRGYLLTGLSRRFSATAAVLLSGFLFAVYQMNVFQFLPHFLFGSALAFIVVQTNSVLPAVLAHLAFNALAFGPLLLPGVEGSLPAGGASEPALSALFGVLLPVLAAAGALVAVAALGALWFLNRHTPGGRPFPTIHFPTDSDKPAPAPALGAGEPDARAPA
jgi:sodium transport system permease protein